MMPEGGNSQLLSSIVKMCKEILALYPTIVSFRALAAKTGISETEIRKAVKVLQKEGAIEIKRINGERFIKAELKPLEKLFDAKKREYFQKYAADARTIEKYRKDLIRGHELELTVAPYVADLLGWVETLPYELVCYDDEGNIYYVDEIMKSVKELDVLIRLGNTLIEVLGSFQPCKFVDVKDYKVNRASIVTEKLMFLQIDAVNGKYAFMTPEWIKSNGRYIVHPEWRSPGVKKFTYRLDYSSLNWNPLPKSLEEKVKKVLQKHLS